MNDSDVINYLISHAPLDRFYLLVLQGSNITLIKYFDSTGVSWNLMEDDDHTVERAIDLLKRTGVRCFEDYAALLEYEQIERARGNGGAEA